MPIFNIKIIYFRRYGIFLGFPKSFLRILNFFVYLFGIDLEAVTSSHKLNKFRFLYHLANNFYYRFIQYFFNYLPCKITWFAVYMTPMFTVVI